MIYVDIVTSAIPSDWGVLAKAETRKVKAFYRKVANRQKKFKFSAYRHRALRDALNLIFRHKCAYCENSYGASQPVAIEHFRPKSAVLVDGKLVKPGYYWLAAEWSNLLPSCIDCNSPRKHVFEDGHEELMGKGNQFPLANPKRRAKRPGHEKRECPLLLDPSREDPESHFEFFRESHRAVVVRPALVKKRASRRGKHSIEVYGLNRPVLCTKREGHARRLLCQLQHVEERAMMLKKSSRDMECQGKLRRDVRDLMENYLTDKNEFLGMARQLIFPRARKLARLTKVAAVLKELKPIMPPRGWRSKPRR